MIQKGNPDDTNPTDLPEATRDNWTKPDQHHRPPPRPADRPEATADAPQDPVYAARRTGEASGHALDVARAGLLRRVGVGNGVGILKSEEISANVLSFIEPAGAMCFVLG